MKCSYVLHFNWIKAGTSKGLSYMFLCISRQILDVHKLNKSNINIQEEPSVFVFLVLALCSETNVFITIHLSRFKQHTTLGFS